ncbi:transcriptional regulator [Streptococcus suis]|uniref:transcriptional regulator n=1 Tax=Streptococcus suis TaxID=1307 RepID=UPI001C94D33B|nr:transcriptional regulator [Streptococcus suis]MBY5025778.1 transcriptional regulator [Streptococcus suis]QZT17886.1 transcriptional regulator [Streptococcus suis]
MVIVLSNKPNWKIYPEEIAKRAGVSRSTVDKCFKNMEKLKYMHTIKRSLGYKKGTDVHRFAADFPIEDWYIEDYILPKLDSSSVDNL